MLDDPQGNLSYGTAVATIEQGRVTANGVDFGYLSCGDGPLALCLHGFPDSAHTWRDLLPALAGAGFRAIAPFIRGYAPTSVPTDGRYQSGVLAQDAPRSTTHSVPTTAPSSSATTTVRSPPTAPPAPRPSGGVVWSPWPFRPVTP